MLPCYTRDLTKLAVLACAVLVACGAAVVATTTLPVGGEIGALLLAGALFMVTRIKETL